MYNRCMHYIFKNEKNKNKNKNQTKKHKTEFQSQTILDTPKKNTYIASSMKEISVSTSGC